MLRVSPFYDHYTIRIRASCHNNTAPPIKLNKLSCSNTNLILLKQSCLIGQLNVPKLVSKMHVRRSGVYLYRVPTVGRPTLGFWVIPGPDSPLFCYALPISTRPSRLPRRRLAVPGQHDSWRRRQTNRRPGAARPTASPLPGRAAVPTFPVRSGLRRATPTKPTRFILRYVLNTQQPLLITHFLIDSLLIRQDCH